ncbi:MAG: sensor histidine kinase [Myxococcales bacterium]|nr:sensor histidine kinase [Myxococcales bacterium]MCB9713639.1 sensor histidine kinase [Myxococcales bacterium]
MSLKLAATVLVLAVIPLLLVALVNAHDVESQSVSRETQSLQRRSAAAARRLEERVGRLRAYVELVANNPTILAAMGDAPRPGDPAPAAAVAWDQRHPEIFALLVSLRQANPSWFANVYLLDAAGVCIATSERSTKPEMVGRPYDYRPYFQAAIEDREPFVTDVLKNANSPGTGIFVSAPVLVDDAVAGVVVLKVESDALDEVVADLGRTGGSALLVDRFGVVVSDAWTGTLRSTDDPGSLQFHPFASVARFTTLFEQTRRYGTPDGEHYLDRVGQSLDLEPLWSALQQRSPGAAEHDVPPSYGAAPVPTMVGYAPVLGGDAEPYGYVVLGEPAAEFRGPLREIAEQALLRFGLVAFGVALVIALLIRRFSRQVVDLADGARRLADGERAGPLSLARRDELGMLADSIQRLADHARDAVSAERSARERSQRERDVAEALAQARTEAVSRTHAALAAVREALEAPGGDGPSPRLRDALRGATIDLAALGDEALRPRAARVDLASVARRVLDARPEHGSEPRLQLRADEGLALDTDPELLRRILEHLVDNACKFTRRGTVELRVEARGSGAAVVVADTGMGLTARQLARFNGSATEGDEPVGTGGIGLSVARRLARALGATLTAQGEVGRGSTVTLELPAELPAAPPVAPDASA